jgi:DNA-binding winged helix-turn-helix (wHTH) protein
LLYLDDNDKASTEEIVSKVFRGKEINEGNVAVHVCNINKKARAIGGRNIIVSDYGKGYRIAEFI